MTKYWGPPTWLFMHSFIQLMSDDLYTQNITKIIQFIKSICSLLPCPDCKVHAVVYTKNLNPRLVPTKEHMAYYLFKFHNDVNKRTGKPIFTNFKQYETAKLQVIFKNFDNAFNRGTNRNFAQSLARKELVKKIRDFINSNNNKFTWYI